MAESEKIAYDPITRQRLVETLKRCGVRAGDMVEVHADVRAFECLIGKEETVVDALMDVVTPEGTILMVNRCVANSEPSLWDNPQIVPSMYGVVRNSIPGFDPKNCVLDDSSRVVDNFRHREGVVMSSHPSWSFAAWGASADFLCNQQSLHFPLSEESPIGRLYQRRGKVVLIGEDFEACTCLYLAEHKTACRMITIRGASMKGEDGTSWHKYLDLDISSVPFQKIKVSMIRKNMIKETMLGGCKIQVFSASDAVDEAVAYFSLRTVFDVYR